MRLVRWKKSILAALVLLMATFAPVADLGLAQSPVSPLRGTWSGSWQPNGRYDSATVRFFVDGDTLSGELVNPEPLELATIEFDEANLTVVAEGESDQEGHARIDARIEEETRLNGTLALGDVVGDIRLVKWTFQP